MVSKIFGNKHEKDVTALQPIVAEINSEYEKLKALSNDALRAKTTEFKGRIKEYTTSIDEEITSLDERVRNEEELDLEEKEAIYNEIDKLKKERDKKLEDALSEILPEAFAVMKETAYRFTNHTDIVATATDLDRTLAVTKPNIIIKGDEVIYKNEWLAAGQAIKWDMVHYDVQLIGGHVLHSGKIAEMKTGE